MIRISHGLDGMCLAIAQKLIRTKRKSFRTWSMSQVFQHSSGADWALVLYRPTDCGTVKPILMEIHQPIVLSSSIYILLNTYRLNKLHVIILTPLLPVTYVKTILYSKRNLNLISNIYIYIYFRVNCKLHP